MIPARAPKRCADIESVPALHWALAPAGTALAAVERSLGRVDAVRAFAGDDYEHAVVPAAARKLLARFDERSAHYEVRVPGPEHGR